MLKKRCTSVLPSLRPIILSETVTFHNVKYTPQISIDMEKI